MKAAKTVFPPISCGAFMQGRTTMKSNHVILMGQGLHGQETAEMGGVQLSLLVPCSSLG